MPSYVIYIPQKNIRELPAEASNAEKYWKLYIGPLDEIQTHYASARGTFPMPDTADNCLWLNGKAIIPLYVGMFIILIAGEKSIFWKYNGNTLVLENEFDITGVRWKSSLSLGKIRGSYDRCVHSAKRKSTSWRVLPSCPSSKKIRQGNRWYLAHKDICKSCSCYLYDRRLMKKI